MHEAHFHLHCLKALRDVRIDGVAKVFVLARSLVLVAFFYIWDILCRRVDDHEINVRIHWDLDRECYYLVHRLNILNLLSAVTFFVARSRHFGCLERRLFGTSFSQWRVVFVTIQGPRFGVEVLDGVSFHVVSFITQVQVGNACLDSWEKRQVTNVMRAVTFCDASDS